MSRVSLTPHLWRGEVPIPSSKSVAHRQMICAALAGVSPARVTLHGPASADLLATRRCLEALLEPTAAEPVLDCGESGSTLRFLMPVAAALGRPAHFTGQGRLPERPVDTLLAELRRHGVRCDGEHLPLTLQGPLSGGEFALPGNISSQFVTGILLALPLTGQEGVVRLTTPLESRDYVTLTLDAMRRFGVSVEESPEAFRVPGNQRYRACADMPPVEGDWSAAAFPMVAAAIAHGNPEGLLLKNLSAHSAQGDRRVVELLRAFGAPVDFAGTDLRVRPGELQAVEEIDVRAIPDMVPALAVVAGLSRGTTHFVHAERLRLKESDRLEAVRRLLLSLGGVAETTRDTLTVTGVARYHGGVVDGVNDHRIVMAAAAAACAADGVVEILDAQAVSKSWPAFWQAYSLCTGEEISL